jgi:hypothetical protein
VEIACEEGLLFYEMACGIGETRHYILFYSVIFFLRMKYGFQRRTLKVKMQKCMVVRNGGTMYNVLQNYVMSLNFGSPGIVFLASRA